MNKLTKILILILAITAAGMSAVLFEVKNTADAVIVEVSDDGVRFFNPQYTPVQNEKDTIMVIAANSIKANATLERDFDITDMGSTSKDRAVGKSVMKMSVKPGFGIGGDSAIVYYKPKNAFRAQSIIQNTNLVGQTSFASGYLCQASGDFSTAMGGKTIAHGRSSFAIGEHTEAIGVNSIAMGNYTNASGISSTVMGDFSKASGDYSTAMGKNTIASGPFSTAMGSFSTASGEYSTTIGKNTIASGSFSTAIGSSTEASGAYSTAIGQTTEASGRNSTAMGLSTIASGNTSTAMGYATIATGNKSTAFGSNTFAIGNYSTTMGKDTWGYSYGSLTIGKFNKIEGDTASWIPTDPLFVIGNGTDVNHLSNAFEVKKNGNTYINGNAYISGNTYIPSLYTTTSARPQKALYVDAQGKLCVSDVLPPKEQSGAVEQLKKENDELKSRVAKLEELVQKMLKK